MNDNMTHIFPVRSQKIGFVPDRQVFARRLAAEFDKCEATRQAEKNSGPDQKKGG